jgi:hypothetical protein
MAEIASFHKHKGNSITTTEGMMLRVHEMIVLSALEYGSAAYGSAASNAQLKRLEPVYNKGLRLALGTFCICRTENIICESGFERLGGKEKAKNHKHGNSRSGK